MLFLFISLPAKLGNIGFLCVQKPFSIQKYTQNEPYLKIKVTEYFITHTVK